MVTARKMKKRPAKHGSGMRLWALEEARDAVATLRTLQPLLSRADEETLATLMDRELMNHLSKSLEESEQGKREPLENILT